MQTLLLLLPLVGAAATTAAADYAAAAQDALMMQLNRNLATVATSGSYVICLTCLPLLVHMQTSLANLHYSLVHMQI